MNRGNVDLEFIWNTIFKDKTSTKIKNQINDEVSIEQSSRL